MDGTVLYKLSYGLYAIGVMDQSRMCGCIVNTVFQITSDGVIALSMNRNNYTHGLIERSGRFSVSILSEATPASVIGALGFKSGRDADKFAGLDAYVEDGLPLLRENTCGHLICDVVGRHEQGSHTVFFAKVTNAFGKNDNPPMTYEYYHRVIKGSAPKNAPTYRAEDESAAKPEPSVKYRCTVCGYIYDGELANEPDDYRCPICGVSKDRFIRID